MPFDPSRFPLPASPPYAPGTSPYRVAGVVYKSLLGFVAESVPGGLDRVKRELRDPALVAFVSAPFALTSTADVVPLPYLGQAIARARGVTFEQQVRDANRWSARSSFYEVYRALLPIASPEALTVALTRAVTIIQPFGGMKAEALRSTGVRGERTGVPSVLVAWMVFSTSAFLQTALERIGSRAVHAVFDVPIEEERAGGEATYTLPFEITWS